jgi:hypothetical protein
MQSERHKQTAREFVHACAQMFTHAAAFTGLPSAYATAVSSQPA